ncbi:metallophosphoesterase [Geomonas paludis]|uniref:DNA repair exonuclease n=1 Tax=Geomonas paludis TaxID=2740185 RepID=A0A6V8N0W6_9BACT|nr:metallophosphoesterase [Geomonas paludis]UPU34627.1 metallophosphoesterase [Geomonas paludis]GFO64999.1 DNA repair exonuclease [Geomonas paludis]
MTCLLHISDTHFGTEQPEVVVALLALARDHAPDLLVLSGDVTQRARRRQFRAARDFLEIVPALATMVLPGNHDIPLFNLAARIFAPYRNYQEVLAEPLEAEFESDELLVLGVNSTRPRRHTVGEVSAAQVVRVAERLRQAGDRQLRVVVAHQPVRATRDSDRKNLLRGHEAAVRAWADAGADLILGGHIHLPHLRPLKEVFPDLPRRIWSVLAGTAVSSRVRGDVPNSVNLIHYSSTDDPPCCTVERWDFGPPGRFLLAQRQLLLLQRP